MITAQTIQQIINNSPELTEYFVVDITVNEDNIITVKIDSDKGITIDECGEISHIIESSLDREVEDYELEVSSPGLTEPLIVVRQYQKNIGRELELTTNSNEKAKGTITSADDQKVELEYSYNVRKDGKREKITERKFYLYSDIKQAKLKITFK